MLARLDVFDQAFEDLQRVLDDPSLAPADRGLELTTELERAQVGLFQLAERESELVRSLGGLKRHRATGVVRETRDEKEAAVARLGSDADALVREVRVLASKSEELRALAAGRPELAAARLREATDHLDLSAAAYREVEALEDPRRRLAGANKQRT
jgi:hypothetical protein